MLNILVKEAEARDKKNSQKSTSKEKSNVQDVESEEDTKKKELEEFWEKNKHSGCTAKQGWFVFQGHAVVMTKVDVSSNNPWGMYNYYRMQVISEKPSKDCFIKGIK